MICLLALLYIFIRQGRDRLEEYLQAVCLWTLVLLGLCYFWSLVGQLVYLTLAGSYFLLDAGMLFLVLYKRKLKLPIRWQPSSLFLWLCLLCLFGIVLRYALKAIPYNWDSMTYHLARIANWEQNRSVLPYATHIERQIASPVLGAYVNLFVYILGGKHDSLLNLLQCFSYGSNGIILYGIARRLGVSERTAFLAPLLYMGTPIALAEATTTQVDNFATLWLLCFLYFLLPYATGKRKPGLDRESRKVILFAALALSFGYLAKPSVCFGAAVFLCWLLIVWIRERVRIRVMLSYVLLAAGIMAVLLFPGVLINLLAFGSISHEGVGARQLVGSLRPQYLLVNFFKNFTFNFASERVEATGAYIEKFLYALADLFRINLNDPAISEDGGIFTFPDFPALSCDVALNMFVAVAALLSMLWFLFSYRKQRKEIKGFVWFAVLSWLLFCCVLRWERFINRYMIAYLSLLSVIIVLQTEDIRKKGSRFIYYVICCILVIGSLFNYGREINYLRELAPYSPERGYFAYHPYNRQEYPVLCDAVKAAGAQKIGLILGADSFEYPIWRMLDDRDYEIRHIMVKNQTGKYEKDDFMPDCIWAEGLSDPHLNYHGQEYELTAADTEAAIGIYKISRR